jgi:hypothetical protein
MAFNTTAKDVSRRGALAGLVQLRVIANALG